MSTDTPSINDTKQKAKSTRPPSLYKVYADEEKPQNVQATPSSPVMNIEYATEVRFQVPTAPSFSVFGSLLSVLSLLLMTVLSVAMFLQLTGLGTAYEIVPLAIFKDLPTGSLASWTWIPFLFTIFGAGLGFLYELSLLVTGHPFQLFRNKFGQFVQSVRLLNLAPVVSSLFFFTCSMMVFQPELRTALLYLAGAATFGRLCTLLWRRSNLCLNLTTGYSGSTNSDRLRCDLSPSRRRTCVTTFNRPSSTPADVTANWDSHTI